MRKEFWISSSLAKCDVIFATIALCYSMMPLPTLFLWTLYSYPFYSIPLFPSRKYVIVMLLIKP